MIDALSEASAARSGDAADLAAGLAPFPADVTGRIRAWQGSCGRQRVFIAPAAFAEFRMDPRTSLREFKAHMDSFRRDAIDGLICVVDSNQDRGLDTTELRAVLDTWLHVDIVERVPIDGGFRAVAAGRLRDEHIGVAFTLDRACFSGAGRGRAIETLDALSDATIIPAIVFLRARFARRCSGRRLGGLERRIRRLASAGTRPGVIVPVRRWTGGFAAAARHVESVRSAWPARAGESVVQYHRPPLHAEEVERAQRALRQAGERFDASISAATTIDRHNFARWGTYLEAGAYTPQPFDFRSPAGRSDENSIVELVRVPYGAGVRAAWEATRLARWTRLERLLDYFRIESYLRRLSDVGLAQRYHEFFVYNWGTGDPTPRTTLFDCGSLSEFEEARTLVREWRQLREDLGPRCHTGPRRFFAAAASEARARTVSDVTSAIGLQHAEHHYLATIEASEPLRADVLNFAETLPDNLGRALELGAGFGRLAADLRVRASSYTLMDLDTVMLRAAGGPGTVADLHHLPFVDEAFDSVIANNVLEHAYDPLAALAEIRRTLKPAGALYALIPLDGLNPDYQLPAHLWKADLHGIRSAAAAAGLEVEAADAISLYAFAIPAAFPSCDGFVCRLRARRPGNS